MFHNSNDYAKGKAYRADMMRQAEQDRLAEIARSGREQAARFDLRVPARVWRLVMVIALAAGLAIIFFILPLAANAQVMADAGEIELCAPAMLAYRLGAYYYVKGDYERAIIKYSEAIDLVPEAVFAKSASFTLLYWDMGDALVRAGRADEAVPYYRRFLELAGDQATEYAVEYVQKLEDAIMKG